jgi:hypothetical protein
MSCVNKWALVSLLTVLCLVSGCARNIEIKQGVMSTGDHYRFVYVKSRFNIDTGHLWLKVTAQNQEVLNESLGVGYDLYVDVELGAVETAPGKLLIVEERAQRAWIFDSSQRSIKDTAYEEALPLVGK